MTLSQEQKAKALRVTDILVGEKFNDAMDILDYAAGYIADHSIITGLPETGDQARHDKD